MLLRPRIMRSLKYSVLLLLTLLAAEQAGSAEYYEVTDSQSPDSYFLIATDTSGLLGFVGHRHAILAGEWQAELLLDPEDLAASSINVTVQSDSLVLDSERAYRLAEFEKAIPPEKDRLATMARILGPEVLNVSRNPVVEFKSGSIEVLSIEGGGATRMSVSGTLQLRGDVLPPVPLEVAVTMVTLPDRHIFTGSADFLQSDYGIRPFSLAGVVNVRDQIRLVWHLEVERNPR